MRRLPADVSRLPVRVRLAAEIAALEPRDRQVLALCLLEELTPVEAAGTLRVTAAEVERTLAETLARLAAATAAPRVRRHSRRAA